MGNSVRASTLGLVKDVVLALAVVCFFVTLLWSILPTIQSQQLRALEESFLRRQEGLFSRTVDNALERLDLEEQALEKTGLSAEVRQRILLDDLGRQRFGEADRGYYFVLEDSGRILLNPGFPDLVGSNVFQVISPDHVNLGTLLLGAAKAGSSTRVDYRWYLPSHYAVETKTTFVRRLPRLGWVLGSGFYSSSFDSMEAAFVQVSEKTLNETRGQSLLTGLGWALATLSLIVWVYLRVRTLELSLSRQIAALKQYKLLLDKSTIVSRTDRDGIILYVNDTFTEVTGYTRDQAVGVSQNIERHPDTPLATFRELWSTIRRGDVWQGTLKNRKADGTSYYKWATIVPILDEAGAVVEYLSSGHDITEVVENRLRLQGQFMTDPLTGLGSRSKLLLDLEAASQPSLVLVDIVQFVELNRLFGTRTGDEVLRQLAAALLDVADRWRAQVYRLHADTFALLRETVGQMELVADVEASAERLRTFTVPVADQTVSLSLRFGVGTGGSDVMLKADEALARARARRVSIEVHNADDDSNSDYAARLEVLETLRWALEHHRVIPVFQPIVSLSGPQAPKYECLMRVEGPSGDRLSPGAFIGLAKAVGLYLPLSRELFRVGIEAAADHTFDFSVNLTMEDIRSPETMDVLLALVRRHGVGSRLVVELVETEELELADSTERVFEALRSEGVRFAVDDFGAGYSSFDYLLRLSPAFVKIDGSIIQKLTTDPRARDLVSSLVSFARNAGIETVAEFLDREELLDSVRALGVEYGQGWLLGKAGPLPDAGQPGDFGEGPSSSLR